MLKKQRFFLYIWQRMIRIRALPKLYRFINLFIYNTKELEQKKLCCRDSHNSKRRESRSQKLCNHKTQTKSRQIFLETGVFKRDKNISLVQKCQICIVVSIEKCENIEEKKFSSKLIQITLRKKIQSQKRKLKSIFAQNRIVLFLQ